MYLFSHQKVQLKLHSKLDDQRMLEFEAHIRAILKKITPIREKQINIYIYIYKKEIYIVDLKKVRMIKFKLLIKISIKKL